MSDTDKNKDQEKGDEVLRRLLKTPPDPKKKKDDGKSRRPQPSHQDLENGGNAEKAKRHVDLDAYAYR